MAEQTGNSDVPPPTTLNNVLDEQTGSATQASEPFQTAQEFITSQLQLEADAREALPYQFDTCTKALGPLRQNVYSCLTCNPPPADADAPYTPAGVCYSCSISCHGEHELVELFSKRYFVCDCGTKRLPEASTCALRPNPQTGRKGGVHSEEPAATNQYNHNFRNRFCGCGEVYDPHKEKGTMFQCLGLDGGCGEDWWHPECLVGLERDWNQKEPVKQAVTSVDGVSKPAEANDSERTFQERTDPVEAGDPRIIEEEETPLPPGFPSEDDFDHLICYKCVDVFPWMKKYAKMSGFIFAPHSKTKILNGSYKQEAEVVDKESSSLPPASKTESDATVSNKRKAADQEGNDSDDNSVKRSKIDDVTTAVQADPEIPTCKYASLPPPPTESVSLFLPSDFREDLCRCASCFPILSNHPQLLEEEESYEPPISEADADEAGNGSVGSRSLLDRGEAALSNMDRVRAIEGVMAYNHVRDKVKAFLKPYAESGQMVGAEDVKAYFEKLRGDEAAIRAAGKNARTGDGDDGEGDNRKEQSGY